jgi:hypothetical protein
MSLAISTFANEHSTECYSSCLLAAAESKPLWNSNAMHLKIARLVIVDTNQQADLKVDQDDKNDSIVTTLRRA